MTGLSPADRALLAAQLPVGILIPDDETVRLVHVIDGVVETYVGPSAESVTGNEGHVFWFNAAQSMLPVNRMATLNLLAVSDFSPRTAPLLHGTILVTAALNAGKPAGLTSRQINALRRENGPLWWLNWVMHVRVERDCHRRSRYR